MAYLLIHNSDPRAQFRVVFDDKRESWLRLAPPTMSGVRIDPTGLCTSATAFTARRLPPIFPAGWLYAVSDATVGAIEATEPGRHQFIPFAVRRADGEECPGYFLMNVCNMVDAIVPEKTTFERQEVQGTYFYSARSVLMNKSLIMTLSSAVVSSLAVWRDVHLKDHFVSDAVADLIAKSKAKSVHLVPLRVE